MNQKLKILTMELRRRSIFRQGLSFGITLPIDWVRSQKIKAGDIILPVVQEDGSLLLILEAEK